MIVEKVMRETEEALPDSSNLRMQRSDDAVLRHVAAGCNRVAGGLDWGRFIAYASHNTIVLYDLDISQVVATLLGHSNHVSCVQWLSISEEQTGGKHILVSGAADGTIIIWAVHSSLEYTRPTWDIITRLDGHKSGVSSISTLTYVLQNHGDSGVKDARPREMGTQDTIENNDIVSFLVSTGGDGDVVVWCSWGLDVSQQSSWKLLQRLHFGTRIQHCSALTRLDCNRYRGYRRRKSSGAVSKEEVNESDILMALGGVDGRIRLLLLPLHHPRIVGPDVKHIEESASFDPICQLEGHQNWIRGLAFTEYKGDVLLASGSQDRCIRIWKIHTCGHDDGSPAADSNHNLDSLTRLASKPEFSDSTNIRYQVSLEALLVGHEDWVHSVAWKPSHRLPMRNGNETMENTGQSENIPYLLSASMDRTMSLWVPDASSGLWYAKESVGDAGVNHLGYFTGVWSPDGTAIATHGFTGALHVWCRHEDGSLQPRPAASGHYGAVVDACWAGNGGCLLSVSTDQTARIIAEVVPDRQSNTIIGKYEQAERAGHDLESPTEDTSRETAPTIWREIARPQVHGHDFSCVAALPCADPESRALRYASGSEEKMIRVFEAPAVFQETLKMSSGGGALRELPDPAIALESDGTRRSPPAFTVANAYGATLPALGLSNKAIYEDNESVSKAAADDDDQVFGFQPPSGGMFHSEGPDVAPSCAPSAVSGAALEEHLAQNTLWPEIHKLYGHGNDVYSLAADPRGRFLASASKAQSASLARIFLWDVETWTMLPGGQLEGHALTVTQVAFSPDGNFLASASRDRSLIVFRRGDGVAANGRDRGIDPPAAGARPAFVLAGKVTKAHGRVVWGLSWAPDSSFILTSSRDHCIKAWEVNSTTGSLCAKPLLTVSFEDSVRCVAASPEIPLSEREGERADTSLPKRVDSRIQRCLVAVGLENGIIVVAELRWDVNESRKSTGEEELQLEWTEIWRSSRFVRHAAAVRKLCWRAVKEEKRARHQNVPSLCKMEHPLLQLASCSDDHAIRIYEF